MSIALAPATDPVAAVETAVLAHYSDRGLSERIFAALRAAGIDGPDMDPEDLAALEHMHTGGREATRRLIDAIRPQPGETIIDIGCGIGGTAREIARFHHVRVTGVDLCADFVALATELSRRTGLDGRTRFLEGSALALPVPDASFDAAVLMHVGMNVDDKARLLDEAFRVLRPGGRLGLCDVMLGPVAEPLSYPVPWAAGPEASFLAAPETYRALAADAGFTPHSELEFYTESLSHPPVERLGPALARLGSHLLMRDDPRLKITNHRNNLDAGRVTPVQMTFLRP